jgi:hypothetical protein
MDWGAADQVVETVHRFVVFAHVVETLGRAGVIVEGDARRNDVDEGGAPALDRGLDDAAFRLRAAIGGRRELALGEAVDAFALDHVDHVDAAPDRRRIR